MSPAGQPYGARERYDAGAVAAAVDLPAIVEHYGVKLSRHGREYKGLCPFHAERSPSFTIFGKGGRWHFKCFGCQKAGDAISFVMAMENLDFSAALRLVADKSHLEATLSVAQSVKQRLERERLLDERDAAEKAQRSDLARKFWRESRPAPGTLVENYLRSRAIDPDVMGGIPVTLRFHPEQRCYHDADNPRAYLTLPAMIAAVQAPAGNVEAIHRTFLNADGSAKADVPVTKKMFGPCWGNATRFEAAGEVLAAGEGVESTLSVRHALRMHGDQTPCWAALSFGNLGAMILPPVVKKLILLSDADSKKPEQAEKILRKCAAQQRARGLDVVAARPWAGADFNDMLTGRAAAPAAEQGA